MKPKEYLLKHGHITSIGRGRMSREHIAIIKEAVKSGVSIEGYSPSTGPTDKPTASVEKETAKIPKDTIDVYSITDPLRDENALEAYTFFNGDTVFVGMRTACNICRCSLTYCPCPNPRVWVDHEHEGVVKFAVRKQRKK